MIINNILKDLVHMNEQTWLQIGQASESMNDQERAVAAYESALRHNPYSEHTLTLVATLCRSMEKYPKAAEYFQRILKLNESNGEIWGALGHCYLMLDELHKAYSAYQQALYHLPNPREPKLWYGIGILYDRYGSYEHAEDAFSAVIEMDPNFEKSNEIYFRLGVIYKHEHKFENSLECFKYIMSNPPTPLTDLDIRYQIGHVYEQMKEYNVAKETYEKVLDDNPKYAKVLQQLGWLYHLPNTGFTNEAAAVASLTKSLDADQNDAQTWYLLGRCYMAQQKYNEAYNAYQQAVYRDGRNPTFWCSIGVLYYQINQYPDALDAYGRAIRLNPYLPEVWYDLGTLYESCENQTSDALDAYAKALELDPNNNLVKSRIELLKNPGRNSGPPPHPQQPVPQEASATIRFASSGPGAAGGPPPGPAPHQMKTSVMDERNARFAPPGALPRQTGPPPPMAGGPPPPHHYDTTRRPIMLGPQLNRAGLPYGDERRGSMDVDRR